MKNELGGSATQQELRGWGVGGHNGIDRGTGGLTPLVNSNPAKLYHTTGFTRDLIVPLVLPNY